MAKITQLPSEMLIEKAANGVTVTDAKGRAIVLRDPGPLAEFDLASALGPQLSANSTYMSMMLPYLYVAQIDGDPVEPIRSDRQGRALIGRLGHEGKLAVLTGIEQHFSSKDPAQEHAEIKK